MRLNSYIISEYLESCYSILETRIENEKLWLENTYIYDGEAMLEEFTVYVIRGKDLDNLDDIPGACAFVCLGYPLEKGLSCNSEFIVLPDGEKPEKVFNSVQRAFSKYGKWHDDLQTNLFYERGIQSLFELSLPIFDNPMFFHDVDFRIIAYAEESKKLDVPDVYNVAQDRRLDQDTVNALKYHPEYEAAFSKTKPTVWVGTKYDFRTLYTNVNLNGIYFGRIGIDERVRKYRRGDFALLEEFTKMVELAIKHRNLSSSSNYRFYEKKVIAILDGDVYGFDNFDHELENIGWKRNDRYFCIVIQMQERDIKANTVVNSCDQIELELSGCRAIPYNNKILVIALLENGGGKRSDFMSKLAPILREGLFKAGYSQVFHDMFDIRQYYLQALITLQTGLRSGGTKWIYRFEDHVLDYFLDRCLSELPASVLCHETIFNLINYDRLNNTSYCETLRVYLENDSSPTKAMKVLYIHRSTFMYRLERIKSLLSVDIEDRDVKLYLLLQFRLFEREGTNI